ncbi:MAG: lytic transglycosylase domain-containing protein, partial [Deltaproteobacteria bacterium]|nr:lytic transglycosylase domain-containing protein [Deltaproteobacteria bacterium]
MKIKVTLFVAALWAATLTSDKAHALPSVKNVLCNDYSHHDNTLNGISNHWTALKIFEGGAELDQSAYAPGDFRELDCLSGAQNESTGRFLNISNDGPDYDVPVELNAEVDRFIEYFQGRGKKFFTRWLERSTIYMPMAKKMLKENDLPEDLVYLALIESGFNPKAKSRAGATGMWQFMKYTGKRYGLRIDWWIDERKDPVKSTVAAIKYLTVLYERFGSWYL